MRDVSISLREDGQAGPADLFDFSGADPTEDHHYETETAAACNAVVLHLNRSLCMNFISSRSILADVDHTSTTWIFRT